MSEAAFRASPQQRRAWTLRRHGGSSARPFGAHLAFSAAPGLPSGIEAALRRAVVAATARHEVLRTRLEQPPGHSVPVQRIAPQAGAPPAVVDLSHLGERAWRETAHRLAAGAPLGSDLGASPFGALLLRLPGGESAVLLSLASAAGDAASVAALAAEIASEANGSEAPEPALQYPDAAEWQLSLLEGDAAAEGRDFWHRRRNRESAGAGVDEAVPLATAGDGPFRPQELRRSVSAGTRSAVEAIAADAGCDPSTVWLVAWAWLLARLADRPRVTVGALADGRRLDELRSAQGPFARYLPLVLEPDPRRPLVEAARRVAEALEEAMGWQEALAPDEIPAPELLFELAPPVVLDEPFRVVGRHAMSEPFLLRLALDHFAVGEEGGEAGATTLILGRDASRIDSAVAEEWLAALVALIESAAENLAAPLASLPLAIPSDAVRSSAPVPASAGPATLSGEAPDVVEVIARRAAEQPEATAVLDASGAASYGEIAADAARLADRLTALGIGADDVVAIHLPRDRRFVAAVLGTMASGAAYLPLDPGYPRPRLLGAIADAGARILVTGEPEGEAETLTEEFAEGGGTVLRPDTLDGGTPSLIPRPVSPAVAAYVLFTSGSTGRPKGVVVSRGALAASTAARGVHYREPVGVYLLLSSFSFDSSVAGLFWALADGGALALAPGGFQWDLRGLLATAEGWGVTHLLALPSLWWLLLEEKAAADRFPELRCVIVAGEACPASLVELHRRVTPEAELHNEYGPTEGTVWASVAELRSEAPGAAVPIGWAAPHAHLHLRDRNFGGPLPAGAPGELLIGGAGVARGYIGRPAETAARFVPDPWSGASGARLYRSGDRAWRRGDGALVFLGRSDRQVKVRGHRIEPAEIERLLGEHPKVRAAAVVTAGAAEELRLVAWVESAEVPSGLVEELRSWLVARLPEALVPSVITVAAALPRLPNGKLDRAALAEREPEPARPLYVEPESEAERALAAIWGEVLGVEEVGAEDNFFRLGGDSILTVRVRAAAAARGLEFSVQEVFNHPTVRELAAVARQESPVAAAERPVAQERFAGLSDVDRARLPADAEDAFPLLALQEGMLFENARDPAAGHYVDVLCFDLAMPFDAAALRRALGWLAGSHPVLRTSLHLHGFEQPLQVVHRWAEIPLEVGTGSDPPSAEALLAAERARGFDPQQAPLIRLKAYRLDERRVRLVVCEHHAILDGWSAASFLTELLRLYHDLVSGAPAKPPEAPPVGMRRAVELERAALADTASEQYWQERLSGAPAAALPPASAGSPGGRRELPIELSDSLARAVRELARELAVPVRTVLLTAHLRCLAEAGGATEVVTGLVTHGRPEEEGGERALGLFLNTVPFPLRLRAESWRDLIARVHAAEGEMIPHRRFPLAELVRRRGGLLFDNAFNFVHFHVQREAREVAGFEVLAVAGQETTELPLVATFRSQISGSGISGELAVDGKTLGSLQAETLAAFYPRVLAAMTDDPAGRHDGFESGTAQLFSVGDDSVVSWRARLDAPARERSEEPAVATRRTPPANDSERRVAEVFSELLGVADVAAEDDFFRLGGHSLLAGRAAALLRDRMGVDLTLGELLASPTVRAIARAADRRREESVPAGAQEEDWEEVEI
ncbi:MAG: amino acid adenylation domain-containing protein [Acidobacteriota bacterium]